MAKYDEVIKRLGRLRPKDFVLWTCPEIQDIAKVSFEDREFEMTTRRVDVLCKAESEIYGQFYVHLEFEAQLKTGFPVRLHEYNTRIRRECSLPVKTVAIFLDTTKSIRKLEAVDRCELAGKMISQFHYDKIVLPEKGWQEILDTNFPVLLPLIPITRIVKGEEHKALAKAASHIEKISDETLRGELGAVFYLIGSYRYSGTITKVIGEKLMQDLMESKAYREIYETGQKAGKIEGKIETLINILHVRTGVDVPQNLQMKLRDISSTEILDRLIELAVTIDSLENFEAQMNV